MIEYLESVLAQQDDVLGLFRQTSFETSVSSFNVNYCEKTGNEASRGRGRRRRLVQICEDSNIYHDAPEISPIEFDHESEDNEEEVETTQSLLWYSKSDIKRFRKENAMVANTIGFLLDHRDLWETNRNEESGSSAWLRGLSVLYEELCDSVETPQDAARILSEHQSRTSSSSSSCLSVDPSILGLEKLILQSISKDRSRRRKFLKKNLLGQDASPADAEDIRSLSRDTSRPQRLLAHYMAVLVASQEYSSSSSSSTVYPASDRIDF